MQPCLFRLELLLGMRTLEIRPRENVKPWKILCWHGSMLLLV